MELGHRMSHSNFGRLRDEPVLSIKAATIKTLASVLKIRESVVAQAALDSMGIDHGLMESQPDLVQTVLESNEISDYDQELLTALLGVMRQKQGKEVGDHEQRSAPIGDNNVHELRPTRKTRAAHTNRDPEIGMGDSPNET